MTASTIIEKVVIKFFQFAPSISNSLGLPFPTNSVVDYLNPVPFDSRPSVGLAALAIARIRSFISLQEGWDGYGATSIKSATIENATKLLDGFHLPNSLGAPFVAPHPNGTITLEWESLFGEAYLEIGQTRYSFYAKPTVGTAIFLEGKTDMPDIFPMARTISAILFPIQSSSSTVNSAARVNGPAAQ